MKTTMKQAKKAISSVAYDERMKDYNERVARAQQQLVNAKKIATQRLKDARAKFEEVKRSIREEVAEARRLYANEKCNRDSFVKYHKRE